MAFRMEPTLTRPSLEVGYAVFCALVAETVNRIVPDPYMVRILGDPHLAMELTFSLHPG